jgi:uncharacterized membrane protein YfhO
MRAPDFDPTQTVVLESGNPLTGTARGDAKIVGYGPNEILLDVNSSDAGVLVLSEIYYPGWRGWVDDREVEVLRADFLFRAIPIPTGAHRIQLLYDPLSFKIGAGLFGMTMLLFVGAALVVVLKRASTRLAPTKSRREI